MRTATLRQFGICTFVASTLVACIGTLNADLRGRGEQPATADEIKACKGGCSAQKKASCMTDDALLSCLIACEGSTSSQVSQYRDCVQVDACNPSCPARLGPPDAGTPDSGPASDAGHPDARIDAAANDASADAGSDAASALDSTPPDRTLQDCQFACEETTPNVTSCYTNISQGIAACQAKCATAPATSRDTFHSCVVGLQSQPQTNLCSVYLGSCLPIIGG